MEGTLDLLIFKKLPSNLKSNLVRPFFDFSNQISLLNHNFEIAEFQILTKDKQ